MTDLGKGPLLTLFPQNQVIATVFFFRKEDMVNSAKSKGSDHEVQSHTKRLFEEDVFRGNLPF